VWERLNERGAHRDIWIEEVRKVDPLRLGRKLERLTISVEGPRLAFLYDRKARLVLAVDEALGDRPVGTPVRERKDLGAVPRDVDDSDSAVCDDAGDKGAFGQALEAGDGYPPVRSLPLVRGRDCHRSER
jgi:hypothetical protein